jgi:hypothetical protein
MLTMTHLNRSRLTASPATIVVAGALFVLSACTAASEFKSTRYADKQSADAAACDAKAEYLISRDMGHERSFADSQRDSLSVQFANYDARKQRRNYYADCLFQKGHASTSKPQ